LALLPYQAALTLWMVTVLILTPVGAWLAVDATIRRRASMPDELDAQRLARCLSLPLGLLFVPTLANLVHGQLAPAVLFGLALAFWLTRRGVADEGGSPLLAGAVFGIACAVKPHLVLIVAPCWLGFHLWRWRLAGARENRGFVLGALGAVATLCALATALAPSWAADFVDAAGAYVSLTRVQYADVTNAVLPGGPAVQRLLAPFLPSQFPLLSWIVAGVFGAGLIAWAVAGWRTADDPEAQGLSRALIATVLIVPPAWETNAVLLLLPLAMQLGRVARAPRAVVALCAVSVLLSALDLPLYATQPWRNAPLMILAYVALIGAGAGATRLSRARRRFAPAPGAVAPFARG
ncbi:MAG TPA: glycosyltransferase family 87 protein, partial [Chloroflexota bacterium]|nr:glycosyltransferase family 87 protein [Chloroflexota bacterium]